ncbi:hypothetical protein ACFE04_009060 [Oxalis oulophora]
MSIVMIATIVAANAQKKKRDNNRQQSNSFFSSNDPYCSNKESPRSNSNSQHLPSKNHRSQPPVDDDIARCKLCERKGHSNVGCSRCRDKQFLVGTNIAAQTRRQQQRRAHHVVDSRASHRIKADARVSRDKKPSKLNISTQNFWWRI